MPLTLNVGVSKKIGQPDFGSLGASCHIAVELDQSLLQSDVETFHRHVKNIFLVCRQAVDGELAGSAPGGSNPPANGQAHGQSHDQANGRHNGDAGHGHTRPSGRSATQSQVRAIRAIAGRQRIDLAGLLQERFCVSRPEELSLPDASSLIDELKSSAQSRAERQ